MNNYKVQQAYVNDPEIVKQLHTFYRDTLGYECISQVVDKERQLKGIDTIISRRIGFKEYTIDEKIRTKDYDDMLLEIRSNALTGKVGWTIDLDKVTDMIVYVCMDTKRVFVLDYKQLRRLTLNNLFEWTFNRPKERHDVYNEDGNETLCYSIKWEELKAAGLYVKEYKLN